MFLQTFTISENLTLYFSMSYYNDLTVRIKANWQIYKMGSYWIITYMKQFQIVSNNFDIYFNIYKAMLTYNSFDFDI